MSSRASTLKDSLLCMRDWPRLFSCARFTSKLALMPLKVSLKLNRWRTRFAPPYRYWLAAVVAQAVIDLMMMRFYASGPGLTIY